MRETQSTTIRGLVIHTNQLPAMDSFALLARLGRVVGPAFSSIMDMVETKADLEALDVKVLGPAIEALFQNVDGPSARALAREIFACTSVVVNGKHLALDSDENINAAFTGRIATMAQALAFVVKANYADFTAGAPTAPSVGAPKEPST